MKTQSKTLIFKKNSITELNDMHLSNINGGSSPTIVVTPISMSIIISAITVAGVKK